MLTRFNMKVYVSERENYQTESNCPLLHKILDPLIWIWESQQGGEQMSRQTGREEFP